MNIPSLAADHIAFNILSPNASMHVKSWNCWIRRFRFQKWKPLNLTAMPRLPPHWRCIRSYALARPINSLHSIHPDGNGPRIPGLFSTSFHFICSELRCALRPTQMGQFSQQFRGCWRVVSCNSLDPCTVTQIGEIKSSSKWASNSNSLGMFEVAAANRRRYIFTWPLLWWWWYWTLCQTLNLTSAIQLNF